MRTASWVIVNKETGEAMFETYNQNLLHIINTEKYEIMPILKYLGALNRKIQNKEQSSVLDKRLTGASISDRVEWLG